MSIKSIIIEDEPLAEDKLKDCIAKMPLLELSGSFDNATDAICYLQENNVDLIFLDIEMKGLNGIEFMESLQHRPEIIITSAYDQYALKCYEFSVSDYLLKPYSFGRFVQAVEKVSSSLKNQQQNLEHKEYLFVKTEYRIEKVNYNDILYIEGMKDYSRIITPQQKIMTLVNLKGLLQTLPEKEFIRTHKSFIIAIDKIESIERNRIKIGDKLIPVGDTYKNDFYERIGL